MRVSENVCPVKKHTSHTGTYPWGKEPPRARMQNSLRAFLPQAKLQKLYPGDAAFFQNCVIIHREVHSQVSNPAWSWAGLPRATVKRELATCTVFMVSSDLRMSWVCAGDGAQAAGPGLERPCLLPSAHNRDRAMQGFNSGNWVHTIEQLTEDSRLLFKRVTRGQACPSSPYASHEHSSESSGDH